METMTKEFLKTSQKHHKEWLINNYKGERFTAYDVRFEFEQLSGFDFRNAVFKGCSFVNNFITNLNCRDAYFTECDFTDAQLSSAVFYNARFYRCDFTGSTMQETRLRKARFSECEFLNSQHNGSFRKQCEFNYCRNIYDMGGQNFGNWDAVAINHNHNSRLTPGLWISAGCRWLHMKEARLHWNPATHHNTFRAEEMQLRLRMTRRLHKLQQKHDSQ